MTFSIALSLPLLKNPNGQDWTGNLSNWRPTPHSKDAPPPRSTLKSYIITYMTDENIFFGFNDAILLVEFLRDFAPDTEVEVTMAVFHLKLKRFLEKWIL